MSKVKKDYRKKTLKEEMRVLGVAVDKSSLSAKETRKLFKRGNAALNANNFSLAAKHFFKAWEADPDNLGLLTVVSHILAKLGHQAVAINFLEKAIALHGLTEDICKVMGEMALALEMFDAAEKIFSQAVNFNPHEEKYYINIATALEGQGNADGAIEFMEEVVKVLDESSDCWCALATLYKVHQKDRRMAVRAFNKSLELNPNNIVTLNNYAGYCGVSPKVEELTRRALKLQPELAEPHVLLAIYLLQNGKLKEGWEHYEYRNDPSRGSEQTNQYMHGLPTWNGENLKGKSILITSEQGIGDEVMFARGIQHIIDAGAKIFIGCDPRLTSIYERSFDRVKAFAHKDIFRNNIRYRTYPEFDKLVKNGDLKVNYSLPIGSIPLHFWDDISKIPQFSNGYLKPDPALVEMYKDRLSQLGTKPKIGISWRSGYVSESRASLYVGLNNLLPLIHQLDADFICLQYDVRNEELDLVKEKTGKKLHVWSDVDLKQDIEANLAIMENIDQVIGPASATQMLAMAMGVEILMPVWGVPWWCYSVKLSSPQIFYVPNLHIFKIPKVYEWAPLVENLVGICKEKFQ